MGNRKKIDFDDQSMERWLPLEIQSSMPKLRQLQQLTGVFPAVTKAALERKKTDYRSGTPHHLADKLYAEIIQTVEVQPQP